MKHLISLLFIIPFGVGAQTVKKVANNISLPATVFTLATCDSSYMDSTSQNGRLEIKNRMSSLFRITNINPLRYKYYINNQAISNFLSASEVVIQLNPFTAGTPFLTTAPSLNVPKIFTTDTLPSRIRNNIRNYQKINKQYEDSITRLVQEAVASNNITIPPGKDSAAISAKNIKAQTDLKNKMSRFENLHDQNLRDYEVYTGGLPVMNEKFGLLTLYQLIRVSKIKGEDEINRIREFKYSFANEYVDNIHEFKKIYRMLFNLETAGKYDTGPFNADTTIRNLTRAIFGYGLVWSSTDFTTKGLERNIADVKEQLLNKQFQIYEEFVINLATRMGVLVQNEFHHYSSLNNSLEQYNCLSDDMIDSLRTEKMRLDTTFAFIQQTNAELQALVPYLDINTDLYRNIAKGINDNYLYLLNYLKNLDYATKANSIEYTLPTHNNMKNADIVRYTIRREDKITHNQQEYNYDFWLKGGLKVDFSLGIFASRLVDNIYNKVLIDTAGGKDSIRITRQEDGIASFAFGGMVNITPRNGARWLSVGGSLGIAYSSNKSLQALAALSLHFGKTERIILHAGAAFGSVKYIDVSANNFIYHDRTEPAKFVTRDNLHDVKEKDRVYTLRSSDIKFSSFTIPTYDKFIVRPFIGVTYNLSRKNALQATTGTGQSTFTDLYNKLP